MAEWSEVQEQTVNPGEAIVFTQNPVPCRRGLVTQREGTGDFLLIGRVSTGYGGCRCNAPAFANYLVDFGANIAIPDGGTVEEISVAVTIDGTTIPASTMRVTPAAVEEFWNVSRAINAAIKCGCCQSVTIRNTSPQAIVVSDANVIFSKNE